MVVVVPEHGGALKATECRYLAYVISLARLSPTSRWGEILRHEGTASGGTDCHQQPSSFLAISDLVVRVLDGKFSPKTMLTGKNSPVGCHKQHGLRELKCSSYSIPG